MAAEVRFRRRDESIYISKGVVFRQNSSLSATQIATNSEDSRSGSPEGLVIRLRAKQRIRTRRTISEAEKETIRPTASTSHYSGPILKPKRTKSTARTKSYIQLHPLGTQLGAGLPDPGPKSTHKPSKTSRCPTLLTLHLGNSHSRKPFLDSKASPSLTLVNLECTSEALAQLPVRITNIKPGKRPRLRGRGLPIWEEKGAVCHFSTMSMSGRGKGESGGLEKGLSDPEKSLSRRKIVFIKRDNTIEDVLDPDYDQVLSSYYL